MDSDPCPGTAAPGQARAPRPVRPRQRPRAPPGARKAPFGRRQGVQSALALSRPAARERPVNFPHGFRTSLGAGLRLCSPIPAG
jgi:hypothetical protein